MKFWALCTFIISGSALVACGSSTGGGGGGGGGVGGGGTGGSATTSSSSSSTSTSSSSTSTSSSSSSSSGSASCDGTAPDQTACGDSQNGCVACALAGGCSANYQACIADQDCVAFVQCINPCTDQACFDACAQTSPGGAQIYNTLSMCVVCQECYVVCDGAASGCPAP